MSSNRWINAFIGAVTTITLSFTVISPILGGTVAGFLNQRDGVRTGALSGALVAAPALLIMIGVVAVFSAGGIPSRIELLIVLMIIVIIPAYIIGLSALGGYLGIYIRNDLKTPR